MAESEMDTAVESRTLMPVAPGPSYFMSGSLALTTRDSQMERSAGVAGAGFGGPLGIVVSRNASTRLGSVAEITRSVETSLATLPTHSSLLTAEASTRTGEIPRSGGLPGTI